MGASLRRYPLGPAKLLLVSICLTLSACAKHPVRPDPRYAHLGTKVIVDDSPAWSPDGRLIAYHRAFSSSDGPPGVYLISRYGGKPRFITEGDFFGPRHLRFSPDGRRLVASWSLRLLIIDVESGALTWPVYTGDGATYPDWSPDGNLVIYARPFPPTGYPPDSGGIHIYEPATGIDRPLYHNGAVVFGSRTRWSPDGSQVAYIGALSSENLPSVLLVRTDGTDLKVLVPQGSTLPEYLQWYSRPATGLDGVLFRDIGKIPSPTYFVPRRGGVPIRWNMHMGPYDAVSPDGSEVVQDFPQQPDSLKVLFIIDMDDITGATRRQLTRWKAPPPGLAHAS